MSLKWVYRGNMVTYIQCNRNNSLRLLSTDWDADAVHLFHGIICKRSNENVYNGYTACVQHTCHTFDSLLEGCATAPLLIIIKIVMPLQHIRWLWLRHYNDTSTTTKVLQNTNTVHINRFHTMMIVFTCNKIAVVHSIRMRLCRRKLTPTRFTFNVLRTDVLTSNGCIYIQSEMHIHTQHMNSPNMFCNEYCKTQQVSLWAMSIPYKRVTNSREQFTS